MMNSKSECFLSLIFVGLAISGLLTGEASAITNPGFETGDTFGWTIILPPGGSANVVTQHTGASGTTYLPKEGTYFLKLKTNGPGSYSRAEQVVALAAGATLFGWAAFDAQDYVPYNDNARVQIYNSSGVLVATLWYSDVVTVGDYGDGPWTNWTWTAPAAGTYTLRYEIANALDSGFDSFVLFDGVCDVIGDVIYVDENANGANNGTSWADAFNHLQDALAAASCVDEIWVAAGTYTPDQGTGNREATFQLLNNVALYGGFPSGGGEWADRDPNVYETILSGDLNGNDVFVNDPHELLNEPTRGENSYHVVVGSSTDPNAILDGFTITAGNGNTVEVWPTSNGGGMLNDDGHCTVNNCKFIENSAEHCGGIYNHESSIRLTNCTFRRNSSKYDAGAIHNAYSSNPTVTDCTFSENWGGYNGGGMGNFYESNPTLTNCTFSDNSAGYDSGGIWNYESSPTLTNCTFNGNIAGNWGSGMANRNNSNPILTNCTFSGNSAGIDGGGMFNDNSDPNLTNCTFSENSASRGGAMFNYNSNPTVTSCIFTDNSASYGGGMYNFRSSPTVTNCILWGNTAQMDGDQIALYGSANSPSILTISYSDLEGGLGEVYIDPDCSVIWGLGNIGDDPLLVGPGVGDLRLLPASPCIDAGDNTAVPPDSPDLDGDGDTTEPIPFDLAGNPRFVDQPDVPDTGNGTAPIVDMGAYEANYIEVAMRFTPQALNIGSQGKWVKAHFVLPEEFSVEDVDTNTPAVIALLGIESDHINVFINEDKLVEIEAAFSRSDFCALATSDDVTEIIVIGLLNSGQYFYGTDTIKIINETFEYLAVLAVHWLEADCGKPDWCSGFDINQDSIVNFVDFALFDGCCIEVIEE